MLLFFESVFKLFYNSKHKLFSRKETWQWFCALIIAMMLRGDLKGVTSFVRSLNLSPSHYESADHFFHSSAYDVDKLRAQWLRTIPRLAEPYTIADRIILHGDTTIVPREGRKMPLVIKMKQSSADNSKDSYVFCQDLGSVNILVGDQKRQFSIPVSVSFHYGTEILDKWLDNPCRSAKTKMLLEATKTATLLDEPAVLALDRYYMSVPLLQLHQSLKDNPDLRVPELVLRAKNNYAAFEYPPERLPGQRGAPPKKGKKVKLADLFNDPGAFTIVYDDPESGEPKELYRYLKRDLLWGIKLYCPVRFVLTILPDGRRAILASTDLTLQPEEIVEIYASRFKIEEGYKIMKHDTGAFSCHFWSRVVPELDRFARANAPDRLAQVSNPEDQEKIIRCVRAYEMYFLIGSIATGLLMSLCLRSQETPLADALYWTRDEKEHKQLSVRTLQESLRTIFPTLLALEPESDLKKFLDTMAKQPTVEAQEWIQAVFGSEESLRLKKTA